MDKLSEQGLLFSYINGILIENTSKINLYQVNNLTHPYLEFNQRITELQYNLDLDDEKVMEIYCIGGTKEKIDRIQEKVDDCLRKYIPQVENIILDDELNENINIDYFIRLLCKKTYKCKKKHFIKLRKTEGVREFLIIYTSFYNPNEDSFFESTFNIWMENEFPFICGKQMITQGFILRDLRGRRIISAMPGSPEEERYLLIEGGLKVYLREDFPYYRESFGISNSNQKAFSLPDLATIPFNPVNGLKKFYAPGEIFEIWQNIFLYVLVISNIKWDIPKFKKAYNKFLDFLEKEICKIFHADKAIYSKEEFYQIMFKKLELITSYLKGNNESVISKDYLILLSNFYCFISPMQTLLKEVFPLKEETNIFKQEEYLKLLNDIDSKDSYIKGKKLENVINYLFKNTKEFKVMAKRNRSTREEIDISVCNISKSTMLWELGAFILVESKNWSHKVTINVIRELGYIMFYKGNTTTILVARNGVTKEGLKEIKKLALLNKYILVFTINDLNKISKEDDFVQMIQDKFCDLVEATGNDLGLLGE